MELEWSSGSACRSRLRNEFAEVDRRPVKSHTLSLYIVRFVTNDVHINPISPEPVARDTPTGRDRSRRPQCTREHRLWTSSLSRSVAKCTKCSQLPSREVIRCRPRTTRRGQRKCEVSRISSVEMRLNQPKLPGARPVDALAPQLGWRLSSLPPTS